MNKVLDFNATLYILGTQTRDCPCNDKEFNNKFV
jgi:hypothetical protein